MARKRKPTVNRALARAVDLFGSEKALAEAVGIAQQNMNRAIKRGQVSPQLAIGIHRATGGLVTGDQLRPDIWKMPEHVPLKHDPIKTKLRALENAARAYAERDDLTMYVKIRNEIDALRKSSLP